MKTYILQTDSAKRACVEFINRIVPGAWRVEISEHKRRRSIEQNARLWSILTSISNQQRDENGRQYSPETWFEYLKAKYLGKDCILVDGETQFVPRRSSKLNVVQFSDLMMAVESWAITHGVQLFEDDINEPIASHNDRE